MPADVRALRWRRIGEIFDVVADAELRSRDDLLARLCGDDQGLRAEVETLLRADAVGVEFEHGVERARGALAHDWSEAPDSLATGERVGPWRVLREIARGGMGVVLLVERADGQYDQRAALKLVKRGMDSDAIVARFLRERQTLARLEHPHIAHLVDGGVARDGRPYFAMEHVDGDPLPEWCDARAADLDARLELFLQVCSAVQFAHGRLVVHRDIKPSNVLVTAQGQVKLLDFGIARLLDASAPDAGTLLWNDRPLTPAYAAPEQLRGEAATIATDIYGLGAVLYELLAGRRPYAIDAGATLEEARRRVETTSPAAPSEVAQRTGPVQARRLRGDLDTIVLKALRHEPERRYATVDALADDLRRFRRGLPIAARRESAWYRGAKFVARHRFGVAAGALIVVLLVAGVAVSSWEAREKAREAQAAEAVTDFLVGLFAAADPTHSRGSAVSAQELLDGGVARLRGELDATPLTRARLLQTMASTYAALGLYARALPLAEEALALRKRHLAADDPQVAESLDALGGIHADMADYALAGPLLDQALALRQQRLPKDDPAIIASLGNIGTLLQKRGDFAGADVRFRAALEASERRFGADAVETARRLDDYAVNLDQLGRREEGLSALRRALAIREKNLPSNDPAVATSLDNLGIHLEGDEHFVDAMPLLERAVAIRKAVFGPSHPLVGFAEVDLAGIYLDLGRLDEARKLDVDALALLRQSLPPEHPRISEALNMLAIGYSQQGDYAAAAPLLREVATRYARGSGADHPDTLAAKNNLAAVLLHLGDYAAAESLQREVIAHLRADNGQSTDVMDYENLSDTLAHEGKTREAVAVAQTAVAIERRKSGGSSLPLAVAIRHLAYMEEFDGDPATAEAHLRAALAMGAAADPRGDHGNFPWTLPLADFLVGAQRCAEALPLLDAARVEVARPSVPAIYALQEGVLRGRCAAPGAAARLAARQAAVQLAAKPGIAVDAYPNTARWIEEGRR